MRQSTRIGLGISVVMALLVAGLTIAVLYRLEQNRRYAAALQKAETILDQADFDSAIASFSQILQSHPPREKAATAHYDRGRAESAQFRYDDAIRDFNEAIVLGFPGTNAHWGRGYAYQCIGEWDKALSDYEEVLRQDPNVAQVSFNRGLIYMQLKEWAKAVEDFNETIRCRPQDTQAYLNRATAMAELSDLSGAIASLDAAIAINPKFADAYVFRSKVQRRRGKLDLADNDEREAQRLNAKKKSPSSLLSMLVPSIESEGASFLGKGWLAVKAGRYDEAIDFCTKALDTHLDPQRTSLAFMTLGNARAGKGDWDGALHDYDQAVKIVPTNADALANRGNAYANKNLLAKSTLDYDEAICLNPNLAEAYCNRAYNYLMAKHDGNALADLTEAIRIKPDFTEAYARRSMAMMRLKREPEALLDANAAVALKPNSAEAYYYRAHLQVLRRKFGEARADFERLVELDHRSASLNSLAWLCATCPDDMVRDGTRAVKLAKEACDLTDWKDGHLLDTLAAAYAEAGDFNAAAKWQEQAVSKSAGLSFSVRSSMERRLQLYQERKPYREHLSP